MQIQASVAALSLALVAFTAEASVPVTVYNQCSENVDLYDNSAVETIAPGGTTSRTLAEGFSGMFRNGVSSQATLAEFAVTGGFLWYDISIIPTGTVGPGYCGSLEECKAVTGGTGYNTPMQIAPSGCQTVTCLQDGCADAYQYPKDDTKTHACSDTTSVVLTFCPETPTATTVTPEPTTETPSTPEVQYASSNSTSNDEEQEAATVAPSKVTKTGTTTAATPAPVAQVISAPSTSTSSKSSNDNTETANTQASADNGTDSGTYIATGLGGCAVIAAVAVVAVARKKKKELDATEGKDYSQEELMTPVTQINVL
ncbi:Thaumatin protein [Phytophthora nicotianae]|uniref:Thaumatin protein n=1 Tax=Phytophthora nicotianae TaxID=4792 RepID=A0A0W8C2J5_PHYNI|nr:Thaumatin protein [Phytophthora nicotianae]